MIKYLNFFLITLIVSPIAYASLGGDASSINGDLDAKSSKVLTTHSAQYSVHELSKKGLRLHEFLGTDGKIFAIAWQGKVHPDLSIVMGSHFSEFQAALKKLRKNHRRFGMAEVGDLHLEMGGAMGSVHGRVWLSSRIPGGVEKNELK